MKNENGIEKSAALKGQTLVNLLVNNNIKITSSGFSAIDYVYQLDTTKTYIIQYRVNQLPELSDTSGSGRAFKIEWYDGGLSGGHKNIYNKEVVVKRNTYIKIEPFSDNVSRTNFGIWCPNYTSGTLDIDIMLLEYQEGMENWDIPYFEGMQSVQIPSLTTTGKNLCKYRDNWEHGGLTFTNIKNGVTVNGTATTIVDYYITTKVGSINVETIDALNNFQVGTRVFLSNNLGKNSYISYTLNGETNYADNVTIQNGMEIIGAFIRFQEGDVCENLNLTIQLEEGSTATPYEPHQSNTLTVNEDVTLRAVGNVQDTLGLVASEIVQNIGETMLNGNENWWMMDEENITNKRFRVDFISKKDNSTQTILCDKMLTVPNSEWNIDREQMEADGLTISIRKPFDTVEAFKEWLSQNPLTVQYKLSTPTTKTVTTTITDQDNQPQERMKLFPTGYINTSSSTFPPILELKGITHNNKLNMTTTNGTNNTQLATLDNLALDGIICRDGTVVRDSYDVESGLYTKRVFRFTIDEDFIERYKDKFSKASENATTVELNMNTTKHCKYPSPSSKGTCNNIEYSHAGARNRVAMSAGQVWITLVKEELKSYDVDGLLDWIKRNGAIEVAYEMSTPQIIHMQPNMTPYVSTRPYQGSIESQGSELASSYLDYTSEQSIISPKPLGEGDVLRWEQGSQCYIYENDKDYIPLTDYNQKVGTVLDLEDDEQFVENLEGGEIVVDVPFKEKAVYERELVSYEDTVIYPTNASADPDGKVEVDYICGATWQNPYDLSDIQHLGTLREDGQYDVTIRRSGDDEIRFMDGTTHLTLNHEGLNPSEFELTYFNKDNVEVGKYGDTSHMLENTLVDGKLETGMVYGETLVNVLDINTSTVSNASKELTGFSFNILESNNEQKIFTRGNYKKGVDYTLIFNSDYAFRLQIGYDMTKTTWNYYDVKVGRNTIKVTTLSDTSHDYILLRTASDIINHQKVTFSNFIILEGDYTNYPIPIPYFEGVGSTIVNGFTTTGKNLLDYTPQYNGDEYKQWGVTVKTLGENTFLLNGEVTQEINIEFLGEGRNTKYRIKAKPNTKYITRCFIESGSWESAYPDWDVERRVNILACDENETDLTWAQYEVTTKSNQNRLGRVRFTLYERDKVVFNNLVIKVMLVESPIEPTEFEPYHSIQYTLPTPITLNKVGDVADTYDVVSGVEMRNVKVITLDGSEGWKQWQNTVYYLDNVDLGQKRINQTAINDRYSSLKFIVPTSAPNNSNLEVEISETGCATVDEFKTYLQQNPLKVLFQAKTPQTIQHTLIPSTVEMMQEPTFILPQPLRSVPNGICDRLYWDENKGHYCIEKRVGHRTLTGDDTWSNFSITSNGFARAIKGDTDVINWKSHIYCDTLYGVLEYSNFLNYRDYIDANNNPIKECMVTGNPTNWAYMPAIRKERLATQDYNGFRQWFADNPTTVYYTLNKTEVIDLPHLNRKLELPTYPDKLPVGYKAVHPKMNPQIGLTIPYKQLNPPSQPQNLDFQMNKEDYVLTWNDVKEARQYNVILNDNIVATTKVPWYNTGEEIHGYILVEAQNEIADNLSKELYVKTVPKAPAQLTVAHNGLTDNYDFEISFIKSTSSLADRYTVQYRVDGGEWIIQDIPADEVDANVKVLWKFSVFEIENQIEVWATATNDMGTNDILPLSTYYMTPTPQWTYRINSREVFLRWVDESPYDTQYKLRYQYKSDGIYRYAHFEGDKEEIGKLYEAVVALAEDDEVTLELCVISDRENLYCKPIKASKALDPNILPPKNFNYRWLSRGLIEFYWEDVYDVDLEYEAIVEHRLSGETTWIEDRRVFSATDAEGTGTVYRLQYQMEDLEEIRVKVRMKWAMNETEWSESLTTVFIPVEGNPPQWIRRTQTQEGLLVEWEAQEYIDSYHVYVKGDGVELQHLETRDNFIYIDIDYSNPIDIEIYEVSRFTGGIEAEPSDSMRFIPHQNKQQMINNIYHPDTLKYELEVNTVQKAQKVSYQINDINTTPDVRTREAMDVSISSPFIITYHPLEVDVHQKGVKFYGVAETHIKTLDVKTRETVEVLTFERITDKYGMDFTVYTPFASKYPVNLEINQVRIVCLGDSLTSGHPLYWAESGTGDVTASYPYQLAKRLKNQYEVINKGYGSDTTDRCLARFDKDVLAYSPQYCLYQCGTNDLYWD